MGLAVWHLIDGDMVAACVVIGVDHGGKAGLAALFGQMQHVWQQQGEGFIADDIAGAPDRMAKPEGFLLAREAGGACCGAFGADHVQYGGLATGSQCGFQLEMHVEMVFDRTLAAACDEDEMLDAAARASSTTCWITGRSRTGIISLGTALVAGRKRVPRPATGKTALRTGRAMDEP